MDRQLKERLTNLEPDWGGYSLSQREQALAEQGPPSPDEALADFVIAAAAIDGDPAQLRHTLEQAAVLLSALAERAGASERTPGSEPCRRPGLPERAFLVSHRQQGAS